MENSSPSVSNLGHRSILALIVLVMIILGAFGAATTETWRGKATDDPDELNQMAVLCSLEDSFSEIAERVKPGVVSITAVRRVLREERSAEDQSHDWEDFFRRFFEEDMTQPFEGTQGVPLPPRRLDPPAVTAAGSGTIVRRQGDNFYVLTNFHVVEGAYEVNVRLEDNTDLKGVVVGTDPVTDLAVVRISSSKLADRNVVAMGDSSTVKVGSWALAVGSPFGFEHTLTVGVVSAVQRELEEEDIIYPDLIQTDAAINRGNSGGPLVGVDGRVIGINSAIASPTGGFVGLGFAIPINTAKSVLEELIREGRVVRGWLGVGIQELTPVLQEYYKVSEGVLVASVDGKGPAGASGIAGEDIIVRVSDTSINDVRQLQRLIASTQPGKTIVITVVRRGREQTIQVRLGMSPHTPAGRPSPPPSAEGVGIGVRALTKGAVESIGLKGMTGVVVGSVMPGSSAEAAGLETGDIVVSFNGRSFTGPAEFEGLLRSVQPGGIVVLRVIRDGSPRMIGFRVE